MPVGQLIGSSSYGAIAIGASGKLLTRDELLLLIEQYLASDVTKIDLNEDGAEVNSQNMVNAITLNWLVEQFPEITHWYSMRGFKREDGTTVYTSLWNGLRADYGIPDGQVIVEAGTGSCRIYKNGHQGWAPLDAVIDGPRWESFWSVAKDAPSNFEDDAAIKWLKAELEVNGYLSKEEANKAFYFATEQARSLGGIDGFTTLTQKEEMRLEHHAVLEAHKEVPQAALSGHQIVLTVGTGGGSTQGYNSMNGTGFTKKIGLKPLMKLIGDTDITKKIHFQTEKDFLDAQKLVEDELKQYQDTFFTNWFSWKSWYDWFFA